MSNLWPHNHKMPLIGVTGDFGTGKTLFLLSIARPDRTRIYDLEMSSADCAEFEELGLDRVDIPKIMFELYPNGYTAKQLFTWWLKDLKSIQPGRYDVIACDPANEFESGLVDWVASRHQEFHYKTESGFRSMGGVFHGAVKDEWKRVKVDLAQRCQTFAFANHMRGVWIDGEATKEKEAKGKDSFFALSSLYLRLESNPDDKRPSGIVLKTRLKRTIFDQETGLVQEIVPILRRGQRIPVATPAAIRDYINNPVGTRELREDERPQEKVLTEDQRLELQAKKARDERLKAETDASNIKGIQALEDSKAQREEAARQRAREAIKPTTKESKPEKQEEPPAATDGVRALLEEADKKGVKERVVKAIQKTLGEEVTGALTKGQAKRITPAIIKKFSDGLAKM